jgi:hypothetical protein
MREPGSHMEVTLWGLLDLASVPAEAIAVDEEPDDDDLFVRVELCEQERLNWRAPTERWLPVVAQDVPSRT